MDGKIGMYPTLEDTGYADMTHEYGFGGPGEPIAGPSGSVADLEMMEKYETGNGNGNGGKKRVKIESGGSEEIKVKKTRQSQSCDACRARKVKCDRPPPGTAAPNVPVKDVCSHCSHLGLQCTFDYKPKKRGPPNLYLRKLREGGDAASPTSSPNQTRSPLMTTPPKPNVPLSGHAVLVPPPRPFSNYPIDVPQPYLGSSSYTSNPYADTLDTHAGYSATRDDHRDDVGLGHSELPDRIDSSIRPDLSPDYPTTRYLPPQDFGGPNEIPGPSSSTSPLFPFTNKLHPSTSSSPYSRPTHPATQSPTYSSSPHALAVYPHNPSNPLDAVLPRGLLYHIIDLFFDYIYCLTPCLHRPSFLADLHARREERPNEEEWTALVLVVVGATLVQIPRAFVPLNRREVKALVEKCNAAGRGFLAADFHEVKVERLIMSYLTAFMCHLLGLYAVGDMIFGANWALILKLRLNEEEGYYNVDPIEKELRRRIFWLQYGADKTFGAIDGAAVFLSEDECAGVSLPTRVDDEYITHTGYLDQPEDHTPILSGFYYISKLFRLTGMILDKRRRDRRKPPIGLMLQMRINEVNDLFDQVMGLMDHCPPGLKLESEADTRSVGSFSDDWDQHASNDIRQLFLDPKANRAIVKDAYLVQQANIYVTQQMVRYMVLLYRDDLHALQRNTINAESDLDGLASLRAINPSTSSNGIRTPRRQSINRGGGWGRAMFSDEEKDQVVSDLLCILQKIPIQVIAVNSMPMVFKVRFVASTLLDALAPPLEAEKSGVIVHTSQRTARAQSYLWDFLRILSEIEQLYSMSDDAAREL